MRQILQIFFVLLSAVGFSQTPPSGWQILPFTVSGGDCDDLSGGNGEIFISEIFDQTFVSGGGGAIEIYNPTNAIINLSNYTIRRRTQYETGPWDTNIPLSGNLPPNGIYIIKFSNTLGNNYCIGNFTPNLTVTGGINDNDQIQLLKGTVILDDVRTPNTAGYNLIRNADAEVPKQPYNPSDWNSIAQNCNSIGLHTIDPTTPPEIKYITRQPDGALPYTYCDVPTRVRVQMDASITGYVYRYNLSGTTTGYNVTNNTTGLFSNLFEDTYVMTVSVRRSTATNVEICTIEATFTISGGIQTSPIILLNP